MFRISLLALVAIAAAGCGDDSSTASTPTPTTTATASAKAAPAAPAAVQVKNFEYSPATLKVKAGTRVTWRNGDATNHTVTFSGGGGAPRDVDNLAERARATRTFTRAGTFAYVCGFHPNMHGRVVVSG